VGLVRILTTVQQTVLHTFYVDEQPTDATGSVTTSLKRLDGTVVASGTGTLQGTGSGTYSYAVPASALVDTRTLDWTGTVAGAAVTARDIIEVVGGFYFTLKEARDAYPSLSDVNKYPSALLAAKRIVVEQECERIRRQAQVPRFGRFIVDGSGTTELIVPDMELRTCRAASIAGNAAGPFTALPAPSLAAIAAEPSGVLIRTDGEVWPAGRRNVIVEYEYGLDSPDLSIVDASKARLRYIISAPRSGIPDRALSWTTNEGGTYRITVAGPESTGDPDIDAVYKRGANERVWIA
jgi:hypothetical protein